MFVIVLSLVLFNVNAQNFNFELGPVVKCKSGFPFITSFDNDDVILSTSAKNSGVTRINKNGVATHTAECKVEINAEFKVVPSQREGFLYNPTHARSYIAYHLGENIIQLVDGIHVAMHPKNLKAELWAYVYDAKTLKFKKQVMLGGDAVNYVKGKEYYYEKSVDFEVFENEDRIIVSSFEKGGSGGIVKVEVFNSNLEVVSSVNLDLGKPVGDVSIDKLWLKGDAGYFVWSERNEPKYSGKYSKQKHLNSHVVKFMGKKIIFNAPFQIDGIEIKKFKVNQLDDENIISGFYSIENKNGLQGMFNANFDDNTGLLSSVTKLKISDQIKWLDYQPKYIAKQKKKNKVEENLRMDVDYKIHAQTKTKDGGYLITAVNEAQIGRIQSMNLAGGASSVPAMKFSGNILFFKLDKDFNLVWSNYILRATKSSIDSRTSFTTIEIGDKIHVLFDEAAKIKTKPLTYEDISPYIHYTGSIVDYVLNTKTEQITRNVVATEKELEKFNLNFNKYKLTNGNEYLFFANYRLSKKFRTVKLIIN